jgi:hypothetical protein
LNQILKDARRTGVLPDIRTVGQLGVRLTDQSAYEVAKSEGAPLHMNRDDARELAIRYGSFETYIAATEDELGS